MFYVKLIDTDLFLNNVWRTNFPWLFSLNKLIKETCFFSFATNAPFYIFVTDCSNTSQSWHRNGQMAIARVKVSRERRLTFFHRRLRFPKEWVWKTVRGRVLTASFEVWNFCFCSCFYYTYYKDLHLRLMSKELSNVRNLQAYDVLCFNLDPKSVHWKRFGKY